ncbi:MAG TPA: apolipoprotein N-acyltransferase [Pyrinomonadaceae bacterium]|jgi:apolipoprotein N-acyltransferase
MKISSLKNIFPSISNALLALLSAVLLILSFPDFEFSYLAWFALIPLFLAVEREKEFWRKAFFSGWIFGTFFFFGSCWWLTYAPITYAAFPPALAYVLMFGVALAAGFFPALFAAIFSVLLKRFGSFAFLCAPFLWTATEFLRFSVTGNNWNEIGYSQAFAGAVRFASVGGVYLVGFYVVLLQSLFLFFFRSRLRFLEKSKHASLIIVIFFVIFGWIVFFNKTIREKIKEIDASGGVSPKVALMYCLALCLGFFPMAALKFGPLNYSSKPFKIAENSAFVIAVQPNVPMSGIGYEDWMRLRERHTQLAESAFGANADKFINEIYDQPDISEAEKSFYREAVRTKFRESPKIVIFPESPMIFLYTEDAEFRAFLAAFAARNNAYVLFNAAEPDEKAKRNFNSAVLVNPNGEKIAQYDKIHLLPFGEFQPLPDFLASEIPAFVGSFSFGNEFDLIPFGDAKGGVMICFESHFGSLSREYAARGADFLIEMTNDGYLGNTPVLRQHLANSVFRAVETNRPLVRVTNVGITAYINARGEVSDAADVYTEASRVWTVAKSDGGQTFYVRYGDWFAWLCSIASLALIIFSFILRQRREGAESQR